MRRLLVFALLCAVLSVLPGSLFAEGPSGSAPFASPASAWGRCLGGIVNPWQWWQENGSTVRDWVRTKVGECLRTLRGKKESDGDETDGEASSSEEPVASVDALSSLAGDGDENSTIFRLAVLSDLHVGKDGNETMLKKLVEAIDRDESISAVAILGDLVEEIGSPDELEKAVALVSSIRHPAIIVSGNHDYRYSDRRTWTGKKQRASSDEQAKKLERFRKAFSVADLRQSKVVADHHLVFLPADDVSASELVPVSKETLKWFGAVLEKHRDLPTVVFAHAPLAKSFTPSGDQLPTEHAAMQPADEIEAILGANPQVRLWVAGHRHSGIERSLAAVEGVEGVPVPTVRDDAAWIRMLEFSPEGIRSRAYDVAGGRFVPSAERVIED